MRIALYARVSTSDKGQDPENQLAQLREWSHDHKIVGEYVDHESGRKAQREAFTKLFDDAAKRRFAGPAPSGRTQPGAVSIR